MTTYTFGFNGFGQLSRSTHSISDATPTPSTNIFLQKYQIIGLISSWSSTIALFNNYILPLGGNNVVNEMKGKEITLPWLQKLETTGGNGERLNQIHSQIQSSLFSKCFIMNLDGHVFFAKDLDHILHFNDLDQFYNYINNMSINDINDINDINGINDVNNMIKRDEVLEVKGEEEDIPIKQIAILGKNIVLLDNTGDAWMYDIDTQHLTYLHAYSRVLKISGGPTHCLLLNERNEVWSVGGNMLGQLGHGNTTSSLDPEPIEGLCGLKIVDVVCGGWHSLAVDDTGKVYSWGWNDKGQLGRPTTKSELKYVPSHWTTADLRDSSIPGRVTLPDSDERVIRVSCGSSHSVVVTDHGSVWTWGWGAYGQLGHGDKSDQWIPKKVHDLSLITAKEVFCSPWATF
eukprot:Ihof_evm7s3 gene=Ihof_evmTU7s3